MHETRASHTATLLPNGNVLIAGGFKKGPDGFSQIYTRTAELFDPKTNTFTYTKMMNHARCGHTATLLPDRTVLLAGGYNNEGRLSSAELYNPTTQEFTLTWNMSSPRGGMTATLLRNGKVLIAGGCDDDSISAELYNPSSKRFEPTGNLNVNRFAHTATLLNNGNVLIVGGSKNRTVFTSAEIYNLTSGTFTFTGNLNVPRHKHSSTQLPDGKVLIAGGSDDRDWNGQHQTAEIYQTANRSFSGLLTMNNQRFKLPDAAVGLPDGSVLLAGGSKDVELYDQRTRSFKSVAQLTDAFYFATATITNDSSVLILGGYNRRLQATKNAWIYGR